MLINDFKEYIINELSTYYNTITNTKLKEILIYSLEGGKCIRGFIVKHLIEQLTQAPTILWQPIVSIELIHGISLVIDDLPCMDNDTMRRNKLSTFAKFGERQAILTSLFGISEAFNILLEGLKNLNTDTNKYIDIINILTKEWHEYIGKNLVIGQMLDLKENIEELININIPFNNDNIILYKTCSLFIFAFILGGVYSGVDVNLEDYKKMGYHLGIMYQIMDDSRDIETDVVEANIILNKGKLEAEKIYMESKSKFLDLINNNNILTQELLDLVGIIDSMYIN
jgi:geranylgeranyl pyrophosphate synthase